MTSVLTPLRRVWGFVSPSKPAAPQTAEAPPTTNQDTEATPKAIEKIPDRESEDNLEQSTPRSLFSSKPSQYLPGSKRKFELDFESPKTAKKAKMEAALASSKRKREFEFETPQKKNKPTNMSQTMPPMPRSAMKPLVQPRTPVASMKKSVTFNRHPLTDIKTVRPLFGKAGNYAGSVFADVSPLSDSSPEGTPSTPSTLSDINSSQLEMSPTTKSNTEVNTPGARTKFCEDPHDPYWRPQPHNPRPGQFCLPDDLSQYDDEDDESIIEQSTPVQSNTRTGNNTPNTPETVRRGNAAVASDSPETPRLPHAQLPAASPQTAQASTQTTQPRTSSYSAPPKLTYSTPPTSANLFADVGPDAVNKARAAAEKYKPESVGKQASKLSQVTQARSPSSSPNGSRAATPASAMNPAIVAQNSDKIPHERQQEYDEWARNLDWPAPGQKIVEEEIFKSDMMKKIVQEWTEEDETNSKIFWNKNFDQVIEAGRKAEREGKVLMFV